jgi:REP element-mobilizing transposase RayT
MAEYRQSAHAVYDLKYHMIWCTKYRKKILRARIAERARDLIRQICAARNVTIVHGSVSPTTFTCCWQRHGVGAGETGSVHQRPVVAAPAG